ncbi:MAG: FAD-dependent oxidoreductase [Planctomycetes bacterium]|nr:FAD-dependent oxidoreductase [Planctomycetota bacterium]
MASLELTGDGARYARRTVLHAAGLAALAPFVACTRSRGRERITGGFVGPDPARGHRLRDGVNASGPARREDAPIVVVGAGIAGLSAAWRLARAGVRDVRVLELEVAPGGTAAGGENAVSRFPFAAHYVPVPRREQRALCELFAELQVIDGFDAQGRARPIERHLLRAPGERIFAHGRWSEGLYPRLGASAEDVRQLERFESLCAELATRRDDLGKPWFTLPLASGSTCDEVLALDARSMASWLAEHGFDSPRLAWFVEYACRDDFGTLLADTSAFAGLHYFCARGRDPAETERYLTWPEGNAFLVRGLARASGAELVSGALVHAIESDADRAIVRWIDAHGARVETHAEDVVCATPRFVARRLVAQLAGETLPLRSTPWVVASATLERRPEERDFPLAWDNVLFESEALGYVSATHQLDRALRDDVWTWYRPFPSAELAASRAAVLSLPWSAWRDALIADLARAHPDLEEHLVTIDVARFGHGMVRPEPGFLASRAAGRWPWHAGRIVFAGTDLSGLALFEEAQWTGVRAAERVLERRGIAFESWL